MARCSCPTTTPGPSTALATHAERASEGVGTDPLRHRGTLTSISARLAPLGVIALALIASSMSVRAADVESGHRKSQTCAGCHGADGNATITGTPSLPEHPAYYTHWQLLMFRNERRRDPQMTPMAANLSDDDMAEPVGALP